MASAIAFLSRAISSAFCWTGSASRHQRLPRAVDGQRLLQVAKDAHVIHDQAAVLVAEDAVRPGNGLHQRVIPHRLVEIHRGTTWRVEAGHPHGAHKNEPQRVVRVFELLSKSSFTIRFRCGTMSSPAS